MHYDDLQSLKWERVESSNIYAVAYDHKTALLFVCFRKRDTEEIEPGKIYALTRFPPGEYEELLKDASKGSFFAKRIRNNRQYECREVENPQESPLWKR